MAEAEPGSDSPPRKAEDLQLVEAAMRLADFAVARWDARKGYEWKVTVGFWVVLSTAFLKGFYAIPVWLGPAVLIVYANWLQNIWLRHGSDADIAWNYFNFAQSKLELSGASAVRDGETLRIGRSQHKSRIFAWLSRYVLRGRQRGNRRNIFGFLSDWALRFQFSVAAGIVCLIYLDNLQALTPIALVLKR